jgi:hypothetical protein
VLALNGFSQSAAEKQVLKLSADIFTWETENKINLLDSIFADRFFVVNAAGEIQSKDQYLARLKGGNFKHDRIDVEQNTATVVDNTATVAGKGTFAITVSGKQLTLKLSYIEIFTRSGEGENWKILAMKASTLPD